MTIQRWWNFTLFSLALAIQGGVRRAAAQDSACSYERCGLRLARTQKAEFQLFQGADSTPVPLETLLTRSEDSIRVHYAAFQSDQRAAKVLSIIALTTSGAWALYAEGPAYKNPAKEGPTAAMVVIPLSFIFAVAAENSSSRNHLESAISFYNSSLHSSQ
jgi:hypothetical protein